MAKEGQFFKTWRNRWFVLAGRTFSYYTSEGAARPQGVILLKRGTDLLIEENYAKPYCFTIRTGKKRYVVQVSD